jgi:hypothetical protein
MITEEGEELTNLLTNTNNNQDDRDARQDEEDEQATEQESTTESEYNTPTDNDDSEEEEIIEQGEVPAPRVYDFRPIKTANKVSTNNDDWKLNPLLFNQAVKTFGKVDIDLFATNKNKPLENFVTKEQDRLGKISTGTDQFTFRSNN